MYICKYEALADYKFIRLSASSVSLLLIYRAAQVVLMCSRKLSTWVTPFLTNSPMSRAIGVGPVSLAMAGPVFSQCSYDT